MRGRSRHRALAATSRLFLAIALAAGAASAKRNAISTPSGRTIYMPDERFEDVSDQSQRHFVVEVVTGLAPQGNLALLLGVLNVPFHGVEFYGGYGVEANPARTLSGDVRYFFNIEGYRPFLGLGYTYRALTAIDTHSHNVFAEVGYKWVLHTTYHLTLAGGVRRPFAVTVEDGSPLRARDTNPALLSETLRDSQVFVPTLSLKFSRAF
jgi:hypothetical protein